MTRRMVAARVAGGHRLHPHGPEEAKLVRRAGDLDRLDMLVPAVVRESRLIRLPRFLHWQGNHGPAR